MPRARLTLLDPERIRDHFHEQAGWCDALGSPFTAALHRQFARDFDADGPVHELCADWQGNPRKDALGLRIAGALHHAALDGTAPELAAEYPAARPDWDMDRVWPVARDWLTTNESHVRTFMQGPPQTNETRRAIILLPGFLELAHRYARPMHLLELGASAGLNQNWDRFAYDGGNWQRPGRSAVTIRSDWSGPPPAHLDAVPDVASRAACDLSPIDLSDPAAVLRLKCYTWADQSERLERLDAAIRLARETGVTVERADASEWVESRLAARPQDALTVVYHSVFLIYPPADKIRHIISAIETAGTAATDEAPLAWLCYESEALFGGDRTSPVMQARLRTWPGNDFRLIATSDGHVTRVDYCGAAR